MPAEVQIVIQGEIQVLSKGHMDEEELAAQAKKKPPVTIKTYPGSRTATLI